MPPWLQRLPVDPIDLFALQANRITPVTHDFVASDLALEGSPQFFALGSAEPGMLRLTLDLVVRRDVPGARSSRGVVRLVAGCQWK